jgi:DNA-binding NarL/FixJ family response regulator
MILLLSDDLLDASKTIASARAAGIDIAQVRNVAALINRTSESLPASCIVDLHFPSVDIVALVAELARGAKRPRLIAYGSHVDAERLRAARLAGFDTVMPRSQYFEEMPTLIVEWAKSSAKEKS